MLGAFSCNREVGGSLDEEKPTLGRLSCSHEVRKRWVKGRKVEEQEEVDFLSSPRTRQENLGRSCRVYARLTCGSLQRAYHLTPLQHARSDPFSESFVVRPNFWLVTECVISQLPINLSQC